MKVGRGCEEWASPPSCEAHPRCEAAIDSVHPLGPGDFSAVARADTLSRPLKGGGLNLDRNPGTMALLTALARPRIFWLVLIGAWVCTGATEILAQAPAAPPGGTTVVVQGRGLALEWIITIAMCATALFVVCRSSRRN
jgi:hypothetical protein